ncbi:PAS domain S-box protein [candidate division WOR-3 bacterium]|nr:PAS domain S-box protein [candidate division WOR-3 bacterium]
MKKSKNQLSILLFAIVACVILTYYVGFIRGREIVYTHFFYIPIILAGMWYQRKAIFTALFLSIVYILLTHLSPRPVSINTFTRCFILITVAYIIGLISDKRAKGESQLRETRDYMEKLINLANAPIIVWDPLFSITRFNQAFEHLSGYTANEVIGKELSMLFPESSRDESMNKIQHTMKNTNWECEEIPILHKKGDINVALWNSANIYEKDGATLLSTISQGTDITERKRAEQKLKELNHAIEQSSEGIATADLDGKFIFINKRWADMHGYQTDDLIGQPLSILDSPEDKKNFPKVWKEIKKKGFLRGELKRVRKDGSSFPAIMTSSMVKDDKDRPIAIIGTCQDITERRQAEAELRKHRNHLEKLVEERTSKLTTVNEQLQREITERRQAEEELKKRLDQLEVYYKATVGREGRIIELKHEVNELLFKLGKEKRYGV